jgi:hypothetical protein
VVQFVLINITAYRKERKQADEDLQALLKENNNLLKELLAKWMSNRLACMFLKTMLQLRSYTKRWDIKSLAST